MSSASHRPASGGGASVIRGARFCCGSHSFSSQWRLGSGWDPSRFRTAPSVSSTRREPRNDIHTTPSARMFRSPSQQLQALPSRVARLTARRWPRLDRAPARPPPNSHRGPATATKVRSWRKSRSESANRVCAAMTQWRRAVTSTPCRSTTSCACCLQAAGLTSMDQFRSISGMAVRHVHGRDGGNE